MAAVRITNGQRPLRLLLRIVINADCGLQEPPSSNLRRNVTSLEKAAHAANLLKIDSIFQYRKPELAALLISFLFGECAQVRNDRIQLRFFMSPLSSCFMVVLTAIPLSVSYKISFS